MVSHLRICGAMTYLKIQLFDNKFSVFFVVLLFTPSILFKFFSFFQSVSASFFLQSKSHRLSQNFKLATFFFLKFRKVHNVKFFLPQTQGLFKILLFSHFSPLAKLTHPSLQYYKGQIGDTYNFCQRLVPPWSKLLLSIPSLKMIFRSGRERREAIP